MLGWDIGPQVYLAFAMTLGIFVASEWLGRIYRTRKVLLSLLAVVVATGMGLLFSQEILESPFGLEPQLQLMLALASAFFLGASLYFFGRLFAHEKEEERRAIEEFFKKVDTPIDVAKEVYAGGRRQVSTMPLVGRTIIFLGFLVSMAFFTKLEQLEFVAVTAMVLILWGFGGSLWIFGKRAEKKDAELRALAVETVEH